MPLKYTNKERTAATFNGASFALTAPDDWDSIGDGPTREAVLAWLAAGNEAQPIDPPTFAQLVDANTAAIQAELDRRARERGYDNIVSACSYAAQAAGEPFQAEGVAYLKWRSDVWAHAYAVLAEVKAGTRAMPTPVEAVAEMPALVLP
jgi:hypothetical protein